MIKKPQFIDLIRQGDFQELFVTELGWNKYRGQSRLPLITIDEKDYEICAVAERNGFQVLTCQVDEIPTQSLAKKIDTKLRRQAQDYICIFRLKGTDHDLWVVPVRTNEKRDLVLIEYEAAAKAEFLYSKIDGFSFAIGEETNIVDLRPKVQGAFAVNSEKITKEFYSGFKKEHKAFAEFITGIDDHISTTKNKNKQWYTSVMLNRLMFCYFIQKKGFLNLDTDYLRSKLNWVRQQQGENRFFSTFYKGFLTNLFHDGLNMPTHDKKFEKMYGKIPYLNGGMFDEHQLERDYTGIDIKDEAFIRLFNFFDKWRWHLDTRITATGYDINPDVLGYIFEQYINDRAQMGAYYTKEDITEYIGKNCILPFLIDQVKEKLPEAFAPNGYVWTTLLGSGDKYIYDAVRRGYSPDWKQRIPTEIAKGLITDSMRKEYSETPISDLPSNHIPLAELRSEWNAKTPVEFALPTEIWRETIDRFERCDAIRKKISTGEIRSINDFITYNLDIRSFVYDLLHDATDHHFIAKFYKALQGVSILDPTCGSGAFLFAAMNILEPLYEVCIERMQEFNARNPKLFKEELAEISNKYRSNIQYFIFKSIILRNLYGVDIMVEATEIAKLRLFLKMVAGVDVDRRADNLGLDPLPDIDFNIRCGNTLVGYANEQQLDKDLTVANGDWVAYEANMTFKKEIDTEMRLVAMAYNRFRKQQMVQEMNMAEFKEAKSELRTRLLKLNDLLNRRQFQASAHQDYAEWLASHQPFNWIAEFYQIIHDNGGFDVIIGNPPYVSIKKVTYLTLSEAFVCSDLYGYVLKRIQELISDDGTQGMIVMHNIAFSDSFKDVRKIINGKGSVWWTFYSRIPSGLFEGNVRVRNSIYIKAKGKNIYSSRLHRWYASQRSDLFKQITYGQIDSNDIIPMTAMGDNVKVLTDSINNIAAQIRSDGKYLYFKKIGYNWLSLTEEPPKSIGRSNEDISFEGVGAICLNENYLGAISMLVCGKLGFLNWIIFGDDFNVTKSLILSMSFPKSIEGKDREILKKLYKKFQGGLKKSFQTKLNCGKLIGSYYIPQLWDITEQNDYLVLKNSDTSISEESLYNIYTEVVKTAISLYKSE